MTSVVVGLLLVGCGGSEGERGANINPNVVLYAAETLSLQKPLNQSLIKVTWTNNDKNTELSVSTIIQRKKQGQADFVDIVEVDGSVATYNDNQGLVNGQTYIYRLKIVENNIDIDPVYSVEKSLYFSDVIISNPDDPQES